MTVVLVTRPDPTSPWWPLSRDWTAEGRQYADRLLWHAAYLQRPAPPTDTTVTA